MNPTRIIRNLALIGFMGCGKSSVGHLVANRLQFAFVDTDLLIEEQTGLRVAEVFARRGETAFRELEQAVVGSLADRERTVIATGGGVGANADLLAALKQHALTVWLRASPETIWQRVRRQTHRPLLQVANPQERIRELLTVREPVYRQADVLIHAEDRRVSEVAEQVVNQFHAATVAAGG
jgi:shikimate kinase